MSEKSIKKENPILLLLRWAKQDRVYLIASVLCAFFGGLCYRPLYRDLSPDGRAFIRQLHEADNY